MMVTSRGAAATIERSDSRTVATDFVLLAPYIS